MLHKTLLQPHTPAITSIPSALNRSVVDLDALFMCFCVDVLVYEKTFSWVSRQRRGMEGVIKLKRLGEDELLRIYRSRHWLYNPNPVHSTSKDRLGGRRWGIYWTGVNLFVKTKTNAAIGYLHTLSVQMTMGVKFLFILCFSRSTRSLD